VVVRGDGLPDREADMNALFIAMGAVGAVMALGPFTVHVCRGAAYRVLRAQEGR
jgi:hypothetical protein